MYFVSDATSDVLPFTIAYQDMRHERGAEADWQLGRIPFSQLYLVQLRNVSAGSWQPVIAYEPR